MTTRFSPKVHSAFVRIFENHPRYSPADKVIRHLIDILPLNSTLESVLPKVTVIQHLYATPIYDVMKMSKRITEVPNLDAKLKAGDPSAVDSIRTGHNIRSKKSGADRNFYSFATKYCSFHNPADFPIYDDFLEKFVYRICSSASKKPRIRHQDLQDYSKYKESLDFVAVQFDIVAENYKNLDMGLWIAAKYNQMQVSNPTQDDIWLKDEVERYFGQVVFEPQE